MQKPIVQTCLRGYIGFSGPACCVLILIQVSKVRTRGDPWDLGFNFRIGGNEWSHQNTDSSLIFNNKQFLFYATSLWNQLPEQLQLEKNWLFWKTAGKMNKRTCSAVPVISHHLITWKEWSRSHNYSTYNNCLLF